jgi:serine/threonine protein kinase
MPLETRARLGSYDIGSPIGSGGQGLVYRAQDRKLGREVAVKGLPLVADFEHEFNQSGGAR